MGIQDEHLDVLQNLEGAAVRRYRWSPEMSDYDVLHVYEAVADVYVAERVGRAPRDWRPTALEQSLFDDLKMIFDWRLGRSPMQFEDASHSADPNETIDVDTLLLCIKKICRSVEKWTRRSGRQGYLDFIAQYVR